jgi:hypothetical protein
MSSKLWPKDYGYVQSFRSSQILLFYFLKYYPVLLCQLYFLVQSLDRIKIYEEFPHIFLYLKLKF